MRRSHGLALLALFAGSGFAALASCSLAEFCSEGPGCSGVDEGALPSDGVDANVSPEPPPSEAGTTVPEGGSDPTPDSGVDARAVSSELGLGNGGSGALNVTTARVVINAYASITASVEAGASTVTVDEAAPFTAGSAVMVWRTTGLSAAEQTQTPVDLSNSLVGRYEFVRVVAASGATVTLERPLAYAYAANVSQMIRVPEYTTVTIGSAGSLSAPAWDGAKGGIVAFLATGEVVNEGSIDVDGLGFRGGRRFVASGGGNCPGTTLNGTPSNGYAAKGEGLFPPGYSAGGGGSAVGGRGSYPGGGGGGNCGNSGGGGGSNGGQGGNGGRTYHNDGRGNDVGGLGAPALTASLLDHLFLGGGGGAGEQDQSDQGNATGASGGGVIYVRAKSYAGGVLSARGGAAANVIGDGGGGGGAGGSIVLRVSDGAACTTVRATGGNGASSSRANHGPGGGGGGGRALIQAATSACTAAVQSGVSGTQTSSSATGGVSYSATPTTATPGFTETPPAGGYVPES